MAISQEGGARCKLVITSVNRWGKNLLEEEGGGKATIASLYPGYGEEIIFRSRQKEKAFFPRDSASVPYHASRRYLADSNLESPHSASSLVPFFFSSFLSLFAPLSMPSYFFRIATLSLTK